MTSSNQYEIPYEDIPKGIELSLKNSDRFRTDAEILAEKKRYNSAIPLITLAVEEFGKALWLSEYFEKNTSVPHNVGSSIFRDHKRRIDKVLEYVKDTVKSRTKKTREKYSKHRHSSIPEEYDEQDFKKRMWYVDYQKVENFETPWLEPSWKKQTWKNPLYIEELSFGGGYNDEFGQLYYKYYELLRCAYHGIRKFRNTPLYDKILKSLSPEEFSFDQIESYLEKHFFLKDVISSMSSGGLTIDLHITSRYQWITPVLADIIKVHIKKKYRVKQVDITLDNNDFSF